MMEHLNMQSMDKVAANVAKIRELFPNCVTERINSEGKLEHAIDFDMLKQELSDHVVEGLQERYQFTWPDKRRAILAANAPINKTLRPCREESVDFDNTENLYIEGDNLEVLKLLQETYLGKVKMIYIDPPYNTGNDFVYGDDFKQSIEEYIDNSGQVNENGEHLITNKESNGRFHTDWLNMIYPRLKLAKDLLCEGGVIFISMDDSEVENLKKICDEIFSRKNFITQFVWQKKSSGGQHANNVLDFHEYILCYCKSIANIESFSVERTDEQLSSFKYEDEYLIERGKYLLSPLKSWLDYRQTLIYDIECPDGTVINTQWVCAQTTFKQLQKEGRIVFKKTVSGWSVYKKQYSKENNGRVKPASIILNHGQTSNGKRELKELFDMDVFSFPKPVELISYITSMINENKGLYMDFFSGSATTAHAIMKLNAEDSGKRKFIMVQLPEVCAENSEAYKAGYKNICEIGKERIRRAGQKIKEENPLTTQDLDIGFRVLKCDSSNMEDVYFTPKEYMDKQQSLFVDNIKKDRNDEDLLFDAMLKLDTPLSSKIEKITIAGKTVYNVAQGHLMACFDKNVTDEVITAIAKEMPSYFVMRDSSQADDSVAINFEQIFNTYSPQTVRRVL